MGQSAAPQRPGSCRLAVPSSAAASDRESLPVLLDTTVLVDALRGRGAADRLRGMRVGRQVPWICAVNVEEVVRGIREHERDAVMRLLRGLQLAPLGQAEGTRAGDWRRDFAAKGITLSQSDCLIAAAAVGVRASLATGNPKDFPMPELNVEHWPVGT
jgi:predicted nucleic acid-binding protein